jgi:hypothetical protein
MKMRKFFICVDPWGVNCLLIVASLLEGTFPEIKTKKYKRLDKKGQVRAGRMRPLRSRSIFLIIPIAHRVASRPSSNP